jgi:hypothetical protein
MSLPYTNVRHVPKINDTKITAEYIHENNTKVTKMPHTLGKQLLQYIQDVTVTANADDLDADQNRHLALSTGTPAAGSRSCPRSGRRWTSGGNARRGGVELGAGGCTTSRRLDSGHKQCENLGRKSAEITVVADEAAGCGWEADGGGFCGSIGFSP